MMNDCVSNVISIINNGLRAKLIKINVPNSKKVLSLFKILKEEGYIENFFIKELLFGDSDIVRDGVSQIVVELKYSNSGAPAIKSLIRISKSGRRVYSGIKDLKVFNSGMGVSIISTSKGVMSGKRAKYENVGGEILCQVF